MDKPRNPIPTIDVILTEQSNNNKILLINKIIWQGFSRSKFESINEKAYTLAVELRRYDEFYSYPFY